MRGVSQGLWVLSYLLLSIFVGAVVYRIVGLDQATSLLLGSVIFLFLLQLHAFFNHRRVRREIDHRMMALYEDYQMAMDEVARLRDAGPSSQAKGTDPDLVSELRVLQTLLAQVAAQHVPPAGRTIGQGDKTERSQDSLLPVIHSALEENRVDLYLQPIVRLPSRNVAFYEAFSRVRDSTGAVIFPRDYLPLAEESGLVGTLDNILLFRCIQVIRRLGPRRPNVRFFCNIASGSLEDADFFPQFIDFMVNNLELADRLVFEFAQADVRRHSHKVERSLASLGRRGFHFSMDQVTDLDIDPASLAARHFSFVKVAPELLLSGNHDLNPVDIKERFSRYHIDLIVEKVEGEAAVIDALDCGVEYGQGYLFGEPRPSREDEPRDGMVDFKGSLRDA